MKVTEYNLMKSCCRFLSKINKCDVKATDFDFTSALLILRSWGVIEKKKGSLLVKKPEEALQCLNQALTKTVTQKLWFSFD